MNATITGGWRLGLAGCVAAIALPLTGQAQAPKKVDFAHDIVPLLKARCAECHTNGKYKGSLRSTRARRCSSRRRSCPARAARAS